MVAFQMAACVRYWVFVLFEKIIGYLNKHLSNVHHCRTGFKDCTHVGRFALAARIMCIKNKRTEHVLVLALFVK